MSAIEPQGQRALEHALTCMARYAQGVHQVLAHLSDARAPANAFEGALAKLDENVHELRDAFGALSQAERADERLEAARSDATRLQSVALELARASRDETGETLVRTRAAAHTLRERLGEGATGGSVDARG
jgi:hypothetical protein